LLLLSSRLFLNVTAIINIFIDIIFIIITNSESVIKVEKGTIPTVLTVSTASTAPTALTVSTASTAPSISTAPLSSTIATFISSDETLTVDQQTKTNDDDDNVVVALKEEVITAISSVISTNHDVPVIVSRNADSDGLINDKNMNSSGRRSDDNIIIDVVNTEDNTDDRKNNFVNEVKDNEMDVDNETVSNTTYHYLYCRSYLLYVLYLQQLM
jgi:hypothetical protein